VRNEDQRAQALRDMGGVVVGDLLGLDSMHRAIAGCETCTSACAFLTTIWPRPSMRLRWQSITV
jgi:hypothetical protein